MIILSNICIIILAIFFLFIVSVKLIEFTIITEKISTDTRTILIMILFLLLSGATIPRFYTWLF